MRIDSRGTNKKARVAKIIGVALTALAGALLQHPARAQSVDGAVRLGLEGPLLSYEKSILSSSAAGATDIDSSRITFGTASSGAGIAVGYGITGDLVLGGRVLFSTTKTDLGSLGESDATTFTILPSLEYLLSTGDVRPFIAGSLGYQSTSGSSLSENAFLVGTSVGLHGFATPTFSIDSSLGGYWTKGSAQSGNTDLDKSGYSVVLTIGASGWLGAEPPTPPHPAPSPANSSAPPVPAAGADARSSVTPIVASASAPSASQVLEQKGQLSLSLDVARSEGASLHFVLAGEPEKDGATVQVTLSSVIPGQPSESCGAAQIDVEGTRVALIDIKSSQRPGFESFTTALQGRASVKVMETLAESKGAAALSTCGQQWPLSMPARGRIAEFVRAFRKRAPASAWTKVELPECGMTFDIPATAARHAGEAPQAVAGLKVSVAQFDLPESNGELSVTCVILPPNNKPTRVILDGARSGMLKSTGGKLVKEFDMPGGREMLFDVSGVSALSRALLIQRRLITMVAVPSNVIRPDIVSRFMGSVQVVEP